MTHEIDWENACNDFHPAFAELAEALAVRETVAVAPRTAAPARALAFRPTRAPRRTMRAKQMA